MVLVYVISVMVMYKICYSEVCYLVNRLGVQFSVLYGPSC
jgi:hypothetical protein